MKGTSQQDSTGLGLSETRIKRSRHDVLPASYLNGRNVIFRMKIQGRRQAEMARYLGRAGTDLANAQAGTIRLRLPSMLGIQNRVHMTLMRAPRHREIVTGRGFSSLRLPALHAQTSRPDEIV